MLRHINNIGLSFSLRNPRNDFQRFLHFIPTQVFQAKIKFKTMNSAMKKSLERFAHDLSLSASVTVKQYVGKQQSSSLMHMSFIIVKIEKQNGKGQDKGNSTPGQST